MKDINLNEVLEWCNERRDWLDKEPVPNLSLGIPGDPCFCVVGRTIGDGVEVVIPDSARVGVITADRQSRYELQHPELGFLGMVPDYVADFIDRFDAGGFPELTDPEDCV